MKNRPISPTIAQALQTAISQLPATDDAGLISRRLLAHVLGRPLTYLIAFDNVHLSTENETAYNALIARAARHEPLAYLIGRAPFRDLELIVSPAVLIPRPETEQLVALVLTHIADIEQPRCIDVGTGSGCIAISVAHARQDAAVHAIDLSADALAIAELNAAAYACDNVTFGQGSLLAGIGFSADIIIANLPYVTDDEWSALEPRVKQHEPKVALVGGNDGLDLVRKLLAQAPAHLNAGGALLLEVGWQQGDATAAIARDHFPQADIQCVADFAGHFRFVTIKTA